MDQKCGKKLGILKREFLVEKTKKEWRREGDERIEKRVRERESERVRQSE